MLLKLIKDPKELLFIINLLSVNKNNLLMESDSISQYQKKFMRGEALF